MGLTFKNCFRICQSIHTYIYTYMHTYIHTYTYLRTLLVHVTSDPFWESAGQTKGSREESITQGETLTHSADGHESQSICTHTHTHSRWGHIDRTVPPRTAHFCCPTANESSSYWTRKDWRHCVIQDYFISNWSLSWCWGRFLRRFRSHLARFLIH